MPWWMVLIEGIALLIIGGLLLTNTAATTVFVTQLLGIYWLIAGIFRIVSIFIDSSKWGWKLLAGGLGIIAGIIVLDHPILSPIVVSSAIVLILGIQGIILGVVGIIQAFQGGGWSPAILGIISILFGVILLANLYVFAFSLPLALGLLAIVGGIIAIVQAFRMR